MDLLTAMLSSVFASSKDLISKRLAFRLDGTVSTFASFAFALPFYLVLLAVLSLLGHEVITVSLSFLTLVFLRSVTDTFAEGLKMHALGHGDLSLVVLVLSLSPLFLLVTSPLLTGDHLSVVEVIAVFLVVLGSILMVYRPSVQRHGGSKRGMLLAAGSALFFSLNGCFDRLAVAKAKGTPVFLRLRHDAVVGAVPSAARSRQQGPRQRFAKTSRRFSVARTAGNGFHGL